MNPTRPSYRPFSAVASMSTALAAVAAVAGAVLTTGCTANSTGSSTGGRAAAEATLTAAHARLYPGFDQYKRPASTVSPAARPYVEHGLQWLFGFNDDEAIRCFLRATELDPNCAFAWWGVAYANGININDPVMSERETKDAWDAVQRAMALREHATAVDRALIEALSKRYVWPATDDLKPLEQAYCAAMDEVARTFPGDADVLTLHAEAMMNLQPWSYWTRDGEPKGRATEIVATLERAMQLQPKHPGALHYYIHAVEASKTPQRAELAADTLLHVVPGSSHLVHMPSHIFARLGRYSDAADSNARAVAVDRSYLKTAPEQDYYGLYIAHNLHFLVYASMMEGRYEAAVQGARELETKVPATFMQRYPGVADGWVSALPHVLVRFGKWNELLELPEYAENRPVGRTMRRYGRSIANAALGRVDAARDEIAAFEREAARVPTEWTIGMNPAHAVFPLARKMMHGELAFREGDHDRAFTLLREGAAMEDELLYDEPPGWLQPTRHALGALLMASGRYAEAEQVYREDLERNAKNGWALLGLEKSRRLQQDTEGLDDLVRLRKKAWARADVAPTSSCYCEPGAVDFER